MLVGLVTVTLAVATRPPSAQAFDGGGALCSLTGLVSKLANTACQTATPAGPILTAGTQLAGGQLGSIDPLGGSAGGGLTTLGGSALKAAATVGLAAIAAAAVQGARDALAATAKVIDATTRPALGSAWFQSSYWRMAAIAVLLTLPFLFAAALQALLRTDLSLLLRAAFGYLPLAALAIGVAAPLTSLLLAASDEMSAIVSSAAGNAGAAFLVHVDVSSLVDGSAFLALFVGLVTAAVTISLWIELVIRSAAVYVIVLMLPLFFAAMVWPARRIWAIRSVELLVALILSKFAIVAVLSLGGAALGHGLTPGLGAFLTGVALVLLAAGSPWALMRLLPLHELAGTAAAGLGAAVAGRITTGAAHAYDAAALVESALTGSGAGRWGAIDDGLPGPADAEPAGPADAEPAGPADAEPASPGADPGPVTGGAAPGTREAVDANQAVPDESRGPDVTEARTSRHWPGAGEDTNDEWPTGHGERPDVFGPKAVAAPWTETRDLREDTPLGDLFKPGAADGTIHLGRGGSGLALPEPPPVEAGAEPPQDPVDPTDAPAGEDLP